MWASIAKWAVKVALYAVKHEDEITAIVKSVKDAKK